MNEGDSVLHSILFIGLLDLYDADFIVFLFNVYAALSNLIFTRFFSCMILSTEFRV